MEYVIKTEMNYLCTHCGCCKCGEIFNDRDIHWYFHEIENADYGYAICYECVEEIWMAGGRIYIPEYKGFCESMPNTPEPTVFTVSLEEIKKFDRMIRLLDGRPVLDDTFTEEEKERLFHEMGC